MIMDQLPQWRRYAGLLTGLPQAFQFLETLTPATPDGRYELGSNYCLVQRYRTKLEGAFEAHRKYVDVQYILAGHETILWAPLASLTTVTQPYDAARDIAFFAAPVGHTPLRLGPGQFAILFPEDGHAPGLENAGATDVVKAVVKVAACF
jgi:biofilm protein TabA